MFLPEKDGIRCDLCGQPQKQKFRYFFLSAKVVDVDVTAARTTSVSDDLDVDACEECFKKLKDRVREIVEHFGGKPDGKL